VTTLRLGISTCPNDTFAFYGLLDRRVDLRGLEFEVELLDVQELNCRLFEDAFDVAKASFHAALLLSDRYGVLPSGSALGFGNGPLLLAAHEGTHPGEMMSVDSQSTKTERPPRVLCPGELTTATLLYKLFHPGEGEVEHAVFSEIMPALKRKEADFGVCIHEGRFTWREQGLALVEDLGAVWENATSAPLPLGGILARSALGDDVLDRVQHVIRDSLEYGLAHREETAATMRRHAQELSEEVMFAHVDLYVNRWTLNLGDEGRRALNVLSGRAVQAGIVPPGQAPLGVVGHS